MIVLFVIVRKKARFNISVARHQQEHRERIDTSRVFPYAMNASRVKRDGEVPGSVKRTISASGNFSLSFVVKRRFSNEDSVKVECGRYFLRGVRLIIHDGGVHVPREFHQQLKHPPILFLPSNTYSF